jgi:hypothetical protein
VFTARCGLGSILVILDITEENVRLPKSFPRLRLLFAGVSHRLFGFSPWLVHVRSVLDKMTLGQAVLHVLLSASSHYSSILICTLILMCQRDKPAWAGNLQTEEWSFKMREHSREERCHTVYCQAADGCSRRRLSWVLCVTNCFSLSVAHIQL